MGTSTFIQDMITALLWVSWDLQRLPSSQAACSTCLLVGTAAGYVQLHDSNGEVLLRQRLHTSGPVQRLQLRSHAMGEYIVHKQAWKIALHECACWAL